MKKILIIALDGVVVGASLLLPGISGGTMAIILGIYDDLIHCLSSLRKDMKNSLKILLPFCAGAVVGILLFANLVLKAVSYFQIPMLYLFMGVIIGSVPTLYRKAEIRRLKPLHFLWAGIGISAMVGLMFVPKGLFNLGAQMNVFHFFMLLFSGLVIAVALILPGISVSHMLLILGMYEMIMTSISTAQILPLIPLAIGTVAGIFLCTHFLEKAMNRFPGPTYLMIIGFVLASLVDLFPGFPTGWDLLFSPLMFCGGIGISLLLSYVQSRKVKVASK